MYGYIVCIERGMRLATARLKRRCGRRRVRPGSAAASRAGTSANGDKAMAVNLSMPLLVVEDHNATALILRTLLTRLGFSDVDQASDGFAALTKMREKNYALVISDWNMEPMTGYDLLREVRASPELSQTPFIMITAESKTENVIAAKKAGVSNYIVKPFNAATLKTKMEAVFPG